MATATRKAPWNKSNPKTRKLTPAQKSRARRSAAKAGRPYPNLVDNMRAASGGKSEAGKQGHAKAKATAKARPKTKENSKRLHKA